MLGLLITFHGLHQCMEFGFTYQMTYIWNLSQQTMTTGLFVAADDNDCEMQLKAPGKSIKLTMI